MHYIGIDLGGTKIAAGVTNAQGVILAEAVSATIAGRPYQEIVKDMASCALKALNKAGVALFDVGAVGIGIPGIAENATGTVIFCTNLGWNNVPLAAELNKYIMKPVYIENDATLAGLAESTAGVSRDAKSSVFITLGTGVGGGIIINGVPWTGAHGVASEIGHLTLQMGGIPCTCGKDGCLERYCSATALIRMGKEACASNLDSMMMNKVRGNVDHLSGKIIIDSAKEGDPPALQVFDRYTTYLAMACNNVISFLDPEMIVLGGGISLAGNFLLDAVRKKIPRYLMFKSMPSSRVELAVLGNAAGIIGAAMLCRVMEKGGHI